MREWFPHDYRSYMDHKMRSLIAKHGVTAYGLYWMIVEEMYEQNAVVTQDVLKTVVRVSNTRNAIAMIRTMIELGLFVETPSGITSERVMAQLSERSEKSSKAKESAKVRWKRKANALPTQSERNAITLHNTTLQESTEKKDSLSDESDLGDDGFEAFWALYAHKQKRAYCERKWKALSKSVRAKIMAHLPDYIASTTVDGKANTRPRMHPLTYLNGECWNDDVYQKAMKTIAQPAKFEQPAVGPKGFPQEVTDLYNKPKPTPEEVAAVQAEWNAKYGHIQ